MQNHERASLRYPTKCLVFHNCVQQLIVLKSSEFGDVIDFHHKEYCGVRADELMLYHGQSVSTDVLIHRGSPGNILYKPCPFRYCIAANLCKTDKRHMIMCFLFVQEP